MTRLFQMMLLTTVVRFQSKRRDERGASAVDWLIVVGAVVGIAYFAGDSVMEFAKGLAGKLGK
jgi:hypothetical protein